MKRIKDNIAQIIPSTFAFFIALLSLTVYEFIAYHSISYDESFKLSYFIGAILINLVFAHTLTFVFLCFQSLFFTRRVKNSKLLQVLLVVILTGNYLLTKTFLKTLEPLDDIFYSFSWKDLKTIVGGETSWLTVMLELATLLSLFLFSAKLIRKINLGNKLIWSFGGLAFLAIIFSPSINYQSEKWLATKLVNNKVVYFSAHSLSYFRRQNEQPSKLDVIDQKFLGGPYSNKEYPLVHAFKADREFSNLFKVPTKKPPHLVFIIVESLSTQFVGKYAEGSGHLMPFLDSLSRNSLYFPHIISTAERTYNVLPALFSSTPNTAGRGHFMDLDLPQHMSLLSMLKEHYFSRFYCGVYLEFNNMVNYLNYHETDYLVNSWEKRFNNKFVKENWWGYPDDQLFDKSLVDLNSRHKKLNKSRLDIFLTISTHSPYIFPNQKGITKQLLHELKHNKNQGAYHDYMIENVGKFASYRYTDNSLRSFFKKIKKQKDYDNTIFVILGDHGPYIKNQNQNPLSRASTPILIVSDLIKEPKTYEALSSHLDVLPSFLSLLQNNYQLNVPQQVPFMGSGLRLNERFETKLYQPISSANYQNNFLVYGDYFLEHKQLFKIKNNLLLEPHKDEELKNKMLEKIKNYNTLSSYCINNDKIISEKDYNKHLAYQLHDYCQESVLNTKDEFILFKHKDKYNFDKPLSGLRFEINFETRLDGYKNLDNLPLFAVSIGTSDTLYLWKKAIARLNQTKLRPGWNRVKYVLTLDEQELKKLRRFQVSFNIWNNKKVHFRSKNINLKVYKKES